MNYRVFKKTEMVNGRSSCQTNIDFDFHLSYLYFWWTILAEIEAFKVS